MRYPVSSAAAALFCAASLGVGQPSESGAAAAPKIEFEKYSLPNGLQVVLHVDRKLPMAHVKVG